MKVKVHKFVLFFLNIYLSASSEFFQETLHEYLGLFLSIHTALSDRSSALLTVQTLISDLSSLHAKAGKLESGYSGIFSPDKARIRKVEEMKETIRMTEDAKNVANSDYERIKVLHIVSRCQFQSHCLIS